MVKPCRKDVWRALLVVSLVTLLAPCAMAAEAHGAVAPDGYTPAVPWILPFALILLSIAILPLVPRLSEWWDHNSSKLTVSLALAAVTCAYYGLRGHGFAGSESGLGAVGTVLHHSVINDYIPFLILIFSLYAISGGIRLTGDIPARPLTNCGVLLLGAIMASFVGTTGAAMLLIRPLLQINRERKHVKHTVVFFIFLVCNIGGSLLPVGDPPLFLGYLRGVPFWWTLHLILPWAMLTCALLVVYYFMDLRAYRREAPGDVLLEETNRAPIRIAGRRNLAFLAGVILTVALLVPGEPLPLLSGLTPPPFTREIVLLLLAGISLWATPRRIHAENHFTFHAMAEVACLFIGIFITMQVPVEIIKAQGAAMGVNSPMQFFWFSGLLSSVLDNAPTYVVFFELAGATTGAGALLHGVATATGSIPVQDLLAISCGAVFMGANTYIGNGPNFLVKSIAEHHGVKMPGFFGYMAYSGLILCPLFLLISLVFFR